MLLKKYFCHFIRSIACSFRGAARRVVLLNTRAMSLVEIMIVLVIMGSIVGFMVVNVTGQLKKAQIREARIQMGNLSRALESYYTDCATYPTTEEGLGALVERAGSCNSWGPEPYLHKIPADPWGGEYIYEQDGSSFVLFSLGGDKREGGEGVDADISSNDDAER